MRKILKKKTIIMLKDENKTHARLEKESKKIWVQSQSGGCSTIQRVQK